MLSELDKWRYKTRLTLQEVVYLSNGIAPQIARDWEYCYVTESIFKEAIAESKLKTFVTAGDDGRKLNFLFDSPEAINSASTLLYPDDVRSWLNNIGFPSVFFGTPSDKLGKPNEQDGKPTAEKLQQLLDEANALIAELKATQVQPVQHNQPNESQQLYPCLQPIADIIEAFEHNPDFVKYGQGIKQQVIEDWLFSEQKQTRDKARHIKALITAHYNITT